VAAYPEAHCRAADLEIDASALSRGAGQATRHGADFEGCGLSVDNPWQHGA
jgi:hypothetical protein